MSSPEGMSQSTKIVLLTDCLAYLTGGAERQIFELCRGLDKDKYEIIVASLECVGPAPRDVIESVGVRLAPFPVKRIYGLSGLREGLRFIRFLRREKPDLVMTYHFSSDIWGTLCGRLTGVKRIFSNRRDMGFWRGPRHVWAYRIIDRWVDKIVVNATAIKDKFMKEEGLPEAKVEVIYNGIDVSAFSGQRLANRKQMGLARRRLFGGDVSSPGSTAGVETGIKADDIVIMHVGSLTPVKDHATLIRAFARVVRDRPAGHAPGLKLVLVGEGPLRDKLQSLVASLGLGNAEDDATNGVLFLGVRDDARELMSAADICALTSTSEGLSNAILEYMAAAKPVIATRVGGNPELVQDHYNGILVEPGDESYLAEALDILIKDKSKREEMGKNGRLKAGEFSLTKMLAGYEDLFDKRPAAALSAADSIPKPDNVRGDNTSTHNSPTRNSLTRNSSTRNAPTRAPLKILHLISSGGMFGAEQVILSLSRCADRDVCENVVGALNNTLNPHLEIVDRARESGLPTAVFDSRGRVDIRTIFAIRDYFKKEGVDILHTHNYKADIVGGIAAWLAGRRWIATNHVWHGRDRKLRVYERLDAFLLRMAEQVVGVSDEVRKDLIKSGLRPAKVRVIYNGIDIAAYAGQKPSAALKEALGLNRQDLVIAIVGRLQEEKGHALLLKAVDVICRKRPKVKVLVVGDGPLRADLEREAARLGLKGRVIFTGNRHDMPDIYQVIDILVNASFIEGLPMTILEAMATRVPVIASRVGGIPRVIRDRRNGLLFDAGDQRALTGHLEYLIDNPGQRKAMADAAYQLVQSSYSVEKMTDSYLRLYHNTWS